LHQGKEVYGGLQDHFSARNPLILPGETRTLAEVARALGENQPASPRRQLLIDALIHLGQGDGWGSTQANAAATLALVELLRSDAGTGVQADLTVGDQTRPVESATPLARLALEGTAGGHLTIPADAPPETAVRLTTRYLPQEDGSRSPRQAHGFVVNREALIQRPGSAPPVRTPLLEAGRTLKLKVGEVVEEHLELVNPEERFFVALTAPLAAGVEPLNPRLATAPPEAAPTGRTTLEPAYATYLDDRVAWYYDHLPKGTYHFYFRTRAVTPGSYVQPSARAEAMYDPAVFGQSAGARVDVGEGGP